MNSEERSNDGAPIAVHRAVDLLYEVGAWLHDVACGDAEFDAMHDALDGRLVPFADAALNESRSSVAAVERERDHLDKVRAGLRVQLIERTSQRDASLARIAAVEALAAIYERTAQIDPTGEFRNRAIDIRAALAASPTPAADEERA